MFTNKSFKSFFHVRCRQNDINDPNEQKFNSYRINKRNQYFPNMSSVNCSIHRDYYKILPEICVK